MIIKKIIFASVFSFLLVFSTNTFAQWDIPAAAKNEKSPTEATVDLVLKGKSVYMKKCKACHNVPGADYKQAPGPNLGAKEYLTKRTEAETFYQTLNGKKGSIMGAYKEQLSEEEIWNVVHYIGTFRAGSKIDLASIQQDLELKVELNDGHKINAVVTDKGAPVCDIKVLFSAKRYFGSLPLGVSKTNSKGYASIAFPDDLPGDEAGNAEIIVKFANQDRFGKAEIKKTVNWATPLHIENMTDQRAMWGQNAKTPLWLLFTYLGITISVWLGIIFVVFQILKLKKAGKATA